jgi:hypothetical protein
VFGNIGLVLFQFPDFTHDLREDIRDRLVVAATDAVEEGITGFDIEFYRSYPCAVLAAVVLFFHQ